MALTNTHKFLIASVSFAIGTLLLILSAVLQKTYWTFFLIAPVLLLAVPVIMVPPNPDGEGSFFESLAHFLAGFFLFSVVGLLFVLAHVKAITGQDTILATIALIFFAISVVFAALAMNRNDYYMSSY